MSARLAIALAVGIGLLAGPGAGAAAAAPCDPPPVGNAITCENSKPGTAPGIWDIPGAGSPSIQGFATDISVNAGSAVQFKIDTTASAYRIDIYRIGYYGGDGARKVDTIPTPAAQAQPSCMTDAASGLVDCGNWSVSASWSVPPDAVSGVYIAHLVREDGTSGESHIPFVVRNDASHSAVLFQTSDTTWQAYNQYGGNSLYTGSPAGRAYKVSYNRPFTTRGEGDGGQDAFFNAEYPMVRWLERNGYDVSYMSGLDSDRIGHLIKNHRTFLSVGHDEYWSGNQRANVEAARDAGTNLAFFSGNEVFWKTRWDPSIDGSNTPNRTLVCYKETHAGMRLDPFNPWTGTWRDPRFGPHDGGRPENALTGQLFKVNAGTTEISVPAAYGKWPLWRNTSIASLPAGSVATLADDTLGYEWDENADNGFQPASSIDLSATTADGVDVLEDYGSTYGTGSATHHLNLYRAPSGAFVFGAGTVQWSWGLDSSHDRGNGAADPRMQQATANLLADMGAQGATLQSDLVAPTPVYPMLPTGSTPPPPPPPPPSPVTRGPGEPPAQTGRPSAPGAGASTTGTDSATNQGSSASTAGCLKLTSAVRRIRTGRRTALTATVRRNGRPAAGVRVVLSGAGTSVVRRSDRHGRVRFAVRPRHAGTLRLRVPGQRASCKAAAASVRVR
jgi:hypothetical protein